MDNRLSWRTHTKQIETKIAAKISLLRFLNPAPIEPNANIMVDLYKSLLRTAITYGYPVLLTADNKLWDRIQIIQNKALRAALGLPHYKSVDYIHRIANIPKKNIMQLLSSNEQRQLHYRTMKLRTIDHYETFPGQTIIL